MQQQNYNNHIKKHPLFHYFLVPVSLLLVPAAAINLIISFSVTAVILLLLTVLLHLVIFITRDYAKKNQDRIIRTEMRLRYYLLTGKSFEPFEKQLSFGQVAALRFASDEELLQLLKDTKTFAASSDEIKKQIKNWQPDHMRV